MSGSCSGVQQRLKEVAPYAVHVHCYAHTLNLAVPAHFSVFLRRVRIKQENCPFAEHLEHLLDHMHLPSTTCAYRSCVRCKHSARLYRWMDGCVSWKGEYGSCLFWGEGLMPRL